jgi:hypothetical protein
MALTERRGTVDRMLGCAYRDLLVHETLSSLLLMWEDTRLYLQYRVSVVQLAKSEESGCNTMSLIEGICYFHYAMADWQSLNSKARTAHIHT